MGFAEPDRGLAFGYAMNRMLDDVPDPRWALLSAHSTKPPVADSTQNFMTAMVPGGVFERDPRLRFSSG